VVTLTRKIITTRGTDISRQPTTELKLQYIMVIYERESKVLESPMILAEEAGRGIQYSVLFAPLTCRKNYIVNLVMVKILLTCVMCHGGYSYGYISA